MSDLLNYSVAILQRQHEHYMKLLEVFETRQTWAFNFATLLYTASFSVCGVLIDKMHKPDGTWFPELHFVAAAVAVLSLALPVLMLPLCFLYSDVSVFCAALTEGNLPYINRQYCDLLSNVPGYSGVPKYIGPGVLAFEWLNHRPKPLSIEWVANWRVSLFYIAPISGLLACGYAFALRYYLNPQGFSASFFLYVGVLGTLTSFVALLLTFLACRKTTIARNYAHTSL